MVCASWALEMVCSDNKSWLKPSFNFFGEFSLILAIFFSCRFFSKNSCWTFLLLRRCSLLLQRKFIWNLSLHNTKDLSETNTNQNIHKQTHIHKRTHNINYHQVTKTKHTKMIILYIFMVPLRIPWTISQSSKDS